MTTPQDTNGPKQTADFTLIYRYLDLTALYACVGGPFVVTQSSVDGDQVQWIKVRITATPQKIAALVDWACGQRVYATHQIVEGGADHDG